jgi:hypothetical protein
MSQTSIASFIVRISSTSRSEISSAIECNFLPSF